MGLLITRSPQDLMDAEDKPPLIATNVRMQRYFIILRYVIYRDDAFAIASKGGLVSDCQCDP